VIQVKKLMGTILILAALLMLTAASATAGGYHKPKQCPPGYTLIYGHCKPVPPTPTPPGPVGPLEHPTGFCPNGKRAVAGTDGHVPASGNTNDKCDWSAPARVPHPQYPNG
jgi:hypothetical protein